MMNGALPMVDVSNEFAKPPPDRQSFLPRSLGNIDRAGNGLKFYVTLPFFLKKLIY